MLHKLILGTVQFGLNYGINNHIGKPSEQDVYDVLNLAQANNINCLDTAAAYGNAIDLISNYHKANYQKFNVISKLKYSNQLNAKEYLEDLIKNLQITSLNSILLHNYDDLISYPQLFKELIECKKNGLVKNIGVSIYTNTQFEDCISNKEIDIIQSPFNVLDNENLRGQLLQSALNENKIVHTRSAFLQGLFYIKNNFPKKLEPLKKYIQKVTRIAEKNNYSVAELALNYCLTQKNIQNVLIGVDSKQQLLENIETAKKGISINVVNEIKDIQVKEIELLNPANWN